MFVEGEGFGWGGGVGVDEDGEGGHVEGWMRLGLWWDGFMVLRLCLWW